MSYGDWTPYVSVATRRANAAKEMERLRKKGQVIEPLELQGRKITQTFWGDAWCQHLEKFSDYSNRLPRGRTYVRNGSICHLAITKGQVEAFVSGSELYHIRINIEPLSKNKWNRVKKACAGQIGSMLELLQGHLSNHVMEIVTDRTSGLFPKPSEIALDCDCPDWAELCKHLAAVLYGVGARLDQQPELLFLLRGVDHEELVDTQLDVQTTAKASSRRRVAHQDLAGIFGVDIEATSKPRKKRDATATTKKVVKGRPVKKQAVAKTSTVIHKIAHKSTVKKVEIKKRQFNATAALVRRLRKRFSMTQSEFANLLQVSPASIAKWEGLQGKLNLQPKNQAALKKAAELTAIQAKRRLKRVLARRRPVSLLPL